MTETWKFNIGDELVRTGDGIKRTVRGRFHRKYWVDVPGSVAEPYNLDKDYIEEQYELDVPKFEIGKRYTHTTGFAGFDVVFRIVAFQEEYAIATFRYANDDPTLSATTIPLTAIKFYELVEEKEVSEDD